MQKKITQIDFSFSSLEKISDIHFSLRLALILIIWSIVYMTSITTVEIDRSDARRALIALNMIETGNWIIPQYMGEKYFKKPPLYNWFTIASLKVFGKNDFALHFPSAFTVLLFAIFVAFSPSKLLNSKQRLFTAVIFLTLGGIIQQGRVIDIDSSYISFCGIATVFWLNAYVAEKNGLKLWLIPSIFLGLAMLLKGPLGIIMFYFFIIVILKKNSDFKKLFSLSHLISFSLMLGIFLCWYFEAKSEMSSSGAGKISGTWIKEILLRLNPKDIDISRSLEAGTGIIFGLFPWLLIALPIYTKNLKDNFEEFNLKAQKIFSALFLTMVTFSILVALMSETKARYFMPLYPTFAIFAGFVLGANQSKTQDYLNKNNLLISVFKVIIGAFLIAFYISLLSFLCFRYLPTPDFLYQIKSLDLLVNSIKNADFATLLKILFSCTFITICSIFIYKRIKNFSVGVNMLFGITVYIVISICLFIYSFVLPIKQTIEGNSRNFAMELDSLLPDNEILYVQKNASGEAFLFYFSRKYEIFEVLDKLPANSKFIIITSQSSEHNESDIIELQKYSIISKLKDKKRTFFVLKKNAND